VLRVSAADEVTEDLVRAVHRLLPQLSGSARLPSGFEIDQIVTSQATTLLLARDDSSSAAGPGETGEQAAADRAGTGDAGDVRDARAHDPAGTRDAGAHEPGWPIVGMLTLVTFRLPTGVRAWIEDVVVDSGSRGKGIGEALVQAALELAAARGALTVDLTSRPSREAANRLYDRTGFELRATNVYRLKLETTTSLD
jgi:ribosomal protein S18 acetylase RimI-like enzyme